jgi:hypothetical protein
MYLACLYGPDDAEKQKRRAQVMMKNSRDAGFPFTLCPNDRMALAAVLVMLLIKKTTDCCFVELFDC